MSPRVASLLVVLLLAVATVMAQETAVKYPHVNVATGYTVDAKWPQRPPRSIERHAGRRRRCRRSRLRLHASPASRAGLFRDGKFLRSWGDESIKGAHHMKIDGDGNVWIAVYVAHVVQQYTPDASS